MLGPPDRRGDVAGKEETKVVGRGIGMPEWFPKKQSQALGLAHPKFRRLKKNVIGGWGDWNRVGLQNTEWKRDDGTVSGEDTDISDGLDLVRVPADSADGGVKADLPIGINDLGGEEID